MNTQTLAEISQGKGRYLLQKLGFPADLMRVKKHQPCPMCGGKDRYRYTDYQGRGGYICSQCKPEGGSWVDLALWHTGMGFKDLHYAVKEILGITNNDNRGSYKMTEQEKEYQQHREFLDKVRGCCKHITNTPAELYLKNRGIHTIPPTMRYLPSYKQHGKEYPCLVVRIDNPNGDRVSYQLIHLTQDGKKADVEIVKKILPIERESAGSAVRLFKYTDTLAVCEGVETALAIYDDEKIPVWACLSASAMKRFEVPKDVKNLLIFADSDSNFTGQAAAYHLANKAAVLIGRADYALEKVNVRLLVNKQVVIDSGVKFDYLDLVC